LMKSAALELGRYKITVNAVVPGLIDTPLTRHQERFAQVLQDGGGTPTGSDEEAAKKILSAKTPLGVPGSTPPMSRPWWSSSPPTPLAWFRAPPTSSPPATAPATRRDGAKISAGAISS